MNDYRKLLDVPGMREWYDSLSESEKMFTPWTFWIPGNEAPIYETKQPEDLFVVMHEREELSGFSEFQYLEGVAKSAAKENPIFARKTIEFALSLPGITAIDIHFLYDAIIEVDNIDLKTASSEDINRSITYCKRDVEFLNDFRDDWMRKYSEFVLVHRPLDLLIKLLDYIGDHEMAKTYQKLREIHGLDYYARIEYERQLLVTEIEGVLVSFIRKNPGYIQSAIYSEFPTYEKDDIQHILKISKQIERRRKGRSYELFIHE